MYSFHKYLLVISKDYWGTCKSVDTAELFSKKFSECIGIPEENIDYLLGNDVNAKSVKDKLYKFVYTTLLNNNYNPIIYIYMNGHGNQIIDENGDSISECESEEDQMDEVYQLPDGNVVDDEITNIIDNAIFNSNCIERPKIILFSDHCSSGSMIDNTSKYYDWISFGSCQDYQDSYVSGDGNVMTINLLNVLESNVSILSNITTNEFFKLLDKEMKGSFIGEIQTCTLNASHKDMFTYKIFS